MLRIVISSLFLATLTFGFDVAPIINAKSRTTLVSLYASTIGNNEDMESSSNHDLKYLVSRAESCAYSDECPINEARELLLQIMAVQSNSEPPSGNGLEDNDTYKNRDVAADIVAHLRTKSSKGTAMEKG